MNMLAKRALLAALSVLFTSLSIPSALAQQLPQHLRIQQLLSLQSEAGLETELGADVAMRNGVAAIGMPQTQGTGQVAIFTQGASGAWTRTATIVASDRTEHMEDRIWTTATGARVISDVDPLPWTDREEATCSPSLGNDSSVTGL